MARMRSIKPEFWLDRRLARLVSRDARLLYVALWNQADEHARLQGDSRYIKGHCLPYDDDLSLADVDRLVDELVAAGRVVRYVVDSDPFLFLPKLSKHQRLEPAKVPSRLPGPDEADPDPEPPTPRVAPSEPRANESARRANSSETNVAKHVAGSREHVAGIPPTAERADAPLEPETLEQRTNRLTATYTDRVKLSNFAAIRGVVRKAVRGDYTDGQVTDGLARLAEDGRSVTTDTLRYAIDGMPSSQFQRDGPRESTGTARANGALASARSLQARMDQNATREIGA
ncbi:hypothetical protein [Actinokineospora sp.]|uniref:hypothetical protein n=1 Tax=Actinokineospora sp. TaxID=1872133 RepID=UPI003D6A116A